MKLIIDIPEQMYLNAKADLLCGGAILVDAIKNGIPYEERPQGDLISRDALKQMIPAPIEDEYIRVHQIIDNAPTVEPCYQTTSCVDCGNYDKENHNCPRFCEVIRNLVNEVKDRPQGEWIPVKTRDLTAAENEEHPDITFMWDCPLPDDGQDVIITTSWGDVKIRTFCVDDIGSYFDETDEDDVLAWMPLPEPYTKEASENDNKI